MVQIPARSRQAPNTYYEYGRSQKSDGRSESGGVCYFLHFERFYATPPIDPLVARATVGTGTVVFGFGTCLNFYVYELYSKTYID